MNEIDVYAVGLFADVKHQGFRRGIRRTWRYLKLHAKARHWRSVKNTFNGYLAEPVHDVPGLIRCGSGWTKRRALRSLQRHLAACQPMTGETR